MKTLHIFIESATWKDNEKSNCVYPGALRCNPSKKTLYLSIKFRIKTNDHIIVTFKIIFNPSILQYFPECQLFKEIRIFMKYIQIQKYSALKVFHSYQF